MKAKAACVNLSVPGVFELFSCFDSASFNGTKIVSPFSVFIGMLIWRSASATDGTKEPWEDIKFCANAEAEKATNTTLSDTTRIRYTHSRHVIHNPKSCLLREYR